MKDGEDRVHGLKVKLSDRSCRAKGLEEIYASLHSFFTELMEEALPFATMVVRDEIGTTTRDSDPDDVLLPPYVAKHSCYVR